MVDTRSLFTTSYKELPEMLQAGAFGDSYKVFGKITNAFSNLYLVQTRGREHLHGFETSS